MHLQHIYERMKKRTRRGKRGRRGSVAVLAGCIGRKERGIRCVTTVSSSFQRVRAQAVHLLGIIRFCVTFFIIFSIFTEIIIYSITVISSISVILRGTFVSVFPTTTGNTVVITIFLFVIGFSFFTEIVFFFLILLQFIFEVKTTVSVFVNFRN